MVRTRSRFAFVWALAMFLPVAGCGGQGSSGSNEDDIEAHDHSYAHIITIECDASGLGSFTRTFSGAFSMRVGSADTFVDASGRACPQGGSYGGVVLDTGPNDYLYFSGILSSTTVTVSQTWWTVSHAFTYPTFGSDLAEEWIKLHPASGDTAIPGWGRVSELRMFFGLMSTSGGPSQTNDPSLPTDYNAWLSTDEGYDLVSNCVQDPVAAGQQPCVVNFGN